MLVDSYSTPRCSRPATALDGRLARIVYQRALSQPPPPRPLSQPPPPPLIQPPPPRLLSPPASVSDPGSVAPRTTPPITASDHFFRLLRKSLLRNNSAWSASSAIGFALSSVSTIEPPFD